MTRADIVGRPRKLDADIPRRIELGLRREDALVRIGVDSVSENVEPGQVAGAGDLGLLAQRSCGVFERTHLEPVALCLAPHRLMFRRFRGSSSASTVSPTSYSAAPLSCIATLIWVSVIFAKLLARSNEKLAARDLRLDAEHVGARDCARSERVLHVEEVGFGLFEGLLGDDFLELGAHPGVVRNLRVRGGLEARRLLGELRCLLLLVAAAYACGMRRT